MFPFFPAFFLGLAVMVFFFNKAGLLDHIITHAVDYSGLSPNSTVVVSATDGVDAFLAQANSAAPVAIGPFPTRSLPCLADGCSG